MDLRVNLEDLGVSGTTVSRHGEDVAARHAAADERIEIAQVGWQGSSASAMNARFEQWTVTTTALLTSLSDHAQGFVRSAHEFAEMDVDNSDAMEDLAPRADPV